MEPTIGENDPSYPRVTNGLKGEDCRRSNSHPVPVPSFGCNEDARQWQDNDLGGGEWLVTTRISSRIESNDTEESIRTKTKNSKASLLGCRNNDKDCTNNLAASSKAGNVCSINPCWKVKDTTRMDALCVALIQTGRRVGLTQSRSNGNNVGHDHSLSTLTREKLTNLIVRVWPLPRDRNTNRVQDETELRRVVRLLLLTAALVRVEGQGNEEQHPLYRLKRTESRDARGSNRELVVFEIASFRKSSNSSNPLCRFQQTWLKLCKSNKENKISNHLINEIDTLLDEFFAPMASQMVTAVSVAEKHKIENAALLRGNAGSLTRVTGSTVEERVRQRALRKEEQLQDSISSFSSSLSETRSTNVPQHSKDDLLEHAGILWSHGRSIQERQSATSDTSRRRGTVSHWFKQSSKYNRADKLGTGGRTVIMTLEDVVQLLQQAVRGNKTVKRRHLVTCLHQLCQIIPEWLLLSPTSTATDPKATLWMFHKSDVLLDYGFVRSRILDGKGNAQKSELSSNNICTRSKSLENPPLARFNAESDEEGTTEKGKHSEGATISLLNGNSKPTQPISPSVNGTKKRKGQAKENKPVKRSLFSGPLPVSENERNEEATENDDINAKSNAKPGVSRDRRSPSLPAQVARQESTHIRPKKRLRRPVTVVAGQSMSTMKKEQAASSDRLLQRGDMSRARQGLATSNRREVARGNTKRPRKELRINHNFILVDADYTGGECLPLPENASPRGLKGLFEQMKQGQRI